MQSPAMNVREVAEYLAVDEKTIYRLVQRGELPGFKVAGAWRFAREDLDEWIEAQKKAVAKPKKKAAAKAKKRGKR
jgi:excisionase family DNA binding protein